MLGDITVYYLITLLSVPVATSMYSTSLHRSLPTREGLGLIKPVRVNPSIQFFFLHPDTSVLNPASEYMEDLPWMYLNMQ